MPRGRVRDPLLGQTLSRRYQVQRFVKEEELGKVYEGVDLREGGAVRVKVLHPHLVEDREAFARFGREMVATAAIEHPHTIGMLDFGEHGDVHFIVLEEVVGRTLREALIDGPLGLDRAVPIAAQIAAALEAAHAQGVVHRNLGSHNVLLLDGAQGGDFVKVLDFGLAGLIQEETDDEDGAITTAGTRLGDVHYMAPEYIEHGAFDARADVYALGCILFEMISGRPPFEGAHPGIVMDLHCERPAPSLLDLRPGLPAWLADLVDRLLAKSPDERPAHGGEVLEILRGKTGLSFEPPTVVKRTPAPAASAASGEDEEPVREPTEEIEPPSGNTWMSAAVVAIAVLTLAGLLAIVAAVGIALLI